MAVCSVAGCFKVSFVVFFLFYSVDVVFVFCRFKEVAAFGDYVLFVVIWFCFDRFG